MIKPWPGSGNKNEAEALYLLKGHEPRHRKSPNTGSSEAWERENYPPEETGNSQWDESMRRIQARGLLGTFETDMQVTVSDEEVTAFLGPAPRVEDLPNWIREAIAVEEGGLAAKEKTWPSIPKVKAPYEFKRHPRMYGVIYGLLRYHSLTRDEDGHPQTWVSVVRLAEEAGCTIQWVERTLRGLESLGLISTEMRSGRSSIYTLLLGDPGRIGRVYDLVDKKAELFIDI